MPHLHTLGVLAVAFSIVVVGNLWYHGFARLVEPHLTPWAELFVAVAATFVLYYVLEAVNVRLTAAEKKVEDTLTAVRTAATSVASAAPKIAAGASAVPKVVSKVADIIRR